MNNWEIFGVFLVSVTPVLLVLIMEKNWTRTTKLFITKKVFDCIFPVLTYVWLVFIHYIFKKSDIIETSFWVILLSSVIIIISQLDYFIDQVLFFSKINGKYLNNVRFPFVLLSIFASFLIACTMINYLIYMQWPYFYEIQEGLNHAAVGFEFFYYTFTLMLTYSTPSISAVHVVSKAVQLCEIVAFYIFIGFFFVDLISKSKAAHGLTQE